MHQRSQPGPSPLALETAQIPSYQQLLEHPASDPEHLGSSGSHTQTQNSPPKLPDKVGHAPAHPGPTSLGDQGVRMPQSALCVAPDPAARPRPSLAHAQPRPHPIKPPVLPLSPGPPTKRNRGHGHCAPVRRHRRIAPRPTQAAWQLPRTRMAPHSTALGTT